MNLDSYLKSQKAIVEKALEAILKNPGGAPERLRESMAYSLYLPGKRLRPVLALAGAEAVGGDPSLALPIACALEIIHCYSLIHDDLPAMDDDDLRRGKPTNHKIYGDGIAIVAGDALHAEAFHSAARAYGRLALEGRVNAAVALEALAELAHAAGMSGMCGGQVLDLVYEGNAAVDLNTLEEIHRLKTGRLLEASVGLGGKIAGGTAAQVAALRTYGAAIGLAFQIVDDVLDVEGGVELGKDIGSDEARGKATYPALLGLDRAKVLAKEWIDRALEALSPFDLRADPLRAIAQYVIARRV